MKTAEYYVMENDLYDRNLIFEVVMVTHDIVSARRGNRILYLKDGEIAGELDLGRYVSGDKERHTALRDFLGGMGW